MTFTSAGGGPTVSAGVSVAVAIVAGDLSKSGDYSTEPAARTRAKVERTRNNAVTAESRADGLAKAGQFFLLVGLGSVFGGALSGVAFGISVGAGIVSTGAGYLVASQQGNIAGMFGNAFGMLGVPLSVIPQLRVVGFGARVAGGVIIRGSQVGNGLQYTSLGFGVLTSINEPPGYSTDPRGRLNQYLREQGRLRTD